MLQSKEVHSATEVVLERLRSGDQALGVLTKKHVAWLLEFTKFLFKCPRSAIGISATEARIYLTPIMNPQAPDQFMNEDQWGVSLKQWDVARHQRDLPKVTGLIAYQIEFIRELPNDKEKT